jgi:hypothetical protein
MNGEKTQAATPRARQGSGARPEDYGRGGGALEWRRVVQI